MHNQPANRVLVSGRYFIEHDLRDVTEIVRMFPKLSRNELAKTVCENLEWHTANGQLKLASCYQFFSKPEAEGLITLPPKQESMIRCPDDKIEIGSLTEAGEWVEGTASELGPLDVEPLRDRSDNRLWNEYVEMFIFYLPSRRQSNRDITGPQLLENLKVLFPELSKMPHQETLCRLVEEVEVDQIKAAYIGMMKQLIRKKKSKTYCRAKAIW